MRAFIKRWWIIFVSVFIVGLLVGGSAAKLHFFRLLFTAQKTKTSDDASFSSPSPSPIPETTYILVGDTGSGLPAQKQVATAIKEYCDHIQNCQAVLILGDVIYEEGVKNIDDPQFQTKFEQPYAEINLPFYIAFGNHDYAGCTQCYLDYSAKSQKWNMPASYYSVPELLNATERPPVKPLPEIEFFVIDTEKFDAVQQQWLHKTLQSSTKTWKVIVGHRPIESFEVSKYHEDWSGKTKLLEEVCHTADFYAAGHAHLLEDRGQLEGCSVKQLVAGGGGATIRKVVENNPDRFVHEGYGFLAVTVQGSTLHYQFVDDRGNVLEEQFFQK